MKLKAHRREDGCIELRSVGVGFFREPPRKGDLLAPGQAAGAFEVLGERVSLVVPKGAGGRTTEVATHRRTAVAFGDVLIVVDPESVGAVADIAEESAAAATGLVFCSPMSGRFYARPAPDQAPFVSVGDTVREGVAVALLEVMKTFNRIPYGGEDLPTSAVIKRVLPEDGADVEAGDVLFELEAGEG